MWQSVIKQIIQGQNQISTRTIKLLNADFTGKHPLP